MILILRMFSSVYYKKGLLQKGSITKRVYYKKGLLQTWAGQQSKGEERQKLK